MALSCDVRIAASDAVFSIPALRIGLVSRTCAVNELPALLAETTGSIGSNAPLTLFAAKTTIGEILTPSPELNTERCRELILRCFESDGYTEGRRAFMEKRMPHFKGR